MFGWILSDNIGRYLNSTGMPSLPKLLCISNVSDGDMSIFWDLRRIGISSKENNENTRDAVVEEFINKAIFVMGRYEVLLPWKDDIMKDTLMNNGKHALKRLNKHLVKLDKE